MLQLTNANIEVLNEVLYRNGIFTLLVQEEVEIEFVIGGIISNVSDLL